MNTTCEAVTTTGTMCRYRSKNVHHVITSDGRRLTVHLCGGHSKTLMDTAPRWHGEGFSQTIHRNGESVEVWPAKTDSEVVA